MWVCVCGWLCLQVEESTLLPLEEELAKATMKHFAGTVYVLYVCLF